MSKNQCILFSVLFSVISTMSMAQIDKSTDDNPDVPKEQYLQEERKTIEIEDPVKALSLNDVIEQGLRKNNDQEEREYTDRLLDLSWDDSWEDFWLPRVNLEFTTDQHRVAWLRKGIENPTDRAVSGSFGLNFGDYTVFNWGKDYLDFLNTKATYLRNKEIIKESSRELKHELIIKYFELNFRRHVVSFRRDQLRHASFVYRINREKLTLKKVTRQEFFQARAEYLKAQSDYQEAKRTYRITEEEMAFLINDKVGTRYILQNELRFKKLKTSFVEALELGLKNNPDVINANVNVDNSKRSYEKVLKENLPLPEFKMNLGTYKNQFGTGVNSTRYRTDSGSNLEVVASITATWSLTGTGGLFNSRSTTQSLVNRNLAIRQKQSAEHFMRSEVREYYKRILEDEDQIEVLNARVPNLERTFELILENYLQRRARFIDFSDALLEMIETKIQQHEIWYRHLESKIELAKLIGIEDFPGENFEQLASLKELVK